MSPESGSVLLLMPAAVLIVLLLGSIAVDFSSAYLAERELSALAGAAANDAATFGLDEAAFRRDGTYRLDPTRVEEACRRALAARSTGVLDGASITCRIEGAGVRAEASGRARYVFAPVIPGAPDGQDVSASAWATPALE